ncbi:MAG: hypothetical protein V3U11_04235 [Planctomycetota bacterium]
MNHAARCLPKISLSLLASAVLLMSCSDDVTSGPSLPAFQTAPRPTQDASQDIARLIPGDASIFVHTQSLGNLLNKVRGLVKVFRPGVENLIGLELLCKQVGLRPRDLDATRPAGLAVRVSQMGLPTPVLILPAKSPQDAADIADRAVVSGDYVGVGLGAAPATVAATASPLGRGLPAGDVVVRVNLAPFRGRIQGLLDFWLQAQSKGKAPEDPAYKASRDFWVEWAKALLDSARTLEASVSLNQGKLDVDCVLRFAQGSRLDTGPAPKGRNLPYLAGALPLEDALFVCMVGANPGRWYETFKPIFDTVAQNMPPAEGASFKIYLEQCQELFRHLGDSVVVAFDLNEKGLQGVALMETRDPETFQRDWDTLAATEPHEVAGVSFKILTLKTRLPMKIAMGVVGNQVMILTGDIQELGTKTVAALRAGKRHKLRLLEATAGRLHANPSFLFAFDMRRLTRFLALLA